MGEGEETRIAKGRKGRVRMEGSKLCRLNPQVLAANLKAESSLMWLHVVW